MKKCAASASESPRRVRTPRSFDPVLGRFLQTDPIGSGDDTDRYSYVHNDPIDGADPSGLRDVDIHVWHGEAFRHGHLISVGHVMLSEHNSSQVILSQFPGNGFMYG